MRGQKPAEELSLKELSHKLILVLALTSTARAHELAALDLNYLVEKTDSWEFALDIHVKQSRSNHPGRKIYPPAYKECQLLCVVHTLKEYRKRNKEIRHSSRLLLAMVSPHWPTTSQSVSRWLRDALSNAGVSPTYRAHSTRSASTSAAAEAEFLLSLFSRPQIGHRLGLLGRFTSGRPLRELLHVLLFPCDFIHSYCLVLCCC